MVSSGNYFTTSSHHRNKRLDSHLSERRVGFCREKGDLGSRRYVEDGIEGKMKRAASTTDIHVFNNRPDPLFCQSPPHCDFNDEDGYIRREFDRLSNKEKEKVMKDMYGIDDPIEETPTLVRNSLDEMDNILQSFSSKKVSLQLARDRFPSFFEDEAFRLRFLRVDSFNAKQACNRFIRHIEKKIELFGPDLLGAKITLESLSEEDMDFMRSGGIQVLPAKDRGGRHVMFSSHRNWKYKDVKNVVRECKPDVVRLFSIVCHVLTRNHHVSSFVVCGIY